MVKSGKIQKKSFFDVQTSATGAKVSLYSTSAEELDGKIARLDLTRSLRGKSLELRLRVKLQDGKLIGEPVALELAGSYIRRMMRKGSDYIEDSFVAECKDFKVLVKPFMITRHKVSRAVRRMLRNEAREYLLTHLKTRTTKEASTEITANKLQKELSLKLKKVYPLALCEIRVFEILEKGSVAKVAETESEKKPSEEKRDIHAENKEAFLKDKAEKKEERAAEGREKKSKAAKSEDKE